MIETNGIWAELSSALNRKYKIIDFHDLISDDVDIDLSDLYKIFLNYKDRKFSHNERVIVILRDTEYYASMESVGYTLWNIIHIFNYLDLPPEFFIFLTFHPGRDVEIKQTVEDFNLSQFNVVYNPYMVCLPTPDKVTDIDLNFYKIRYPYICLQGAPRSSRIYNMCNLKKHNILDKGIVSFYTEKPKYFFRQKNIFYKNHLDKLNHTNSDTDNKKIPIPDGLHLRACVPPTRINDLLKLNKAQRQLMIDYKDQIFKKLVHPEIVGERNFITDYKNCQPEFMQKALWNFVVETTADYPTAHISEKTIKAILTKRPFIINGSKNTLQLVKDLGFKTFDKWINEEYDKQNTFAERNDCAISSLIKFCEFPQEKLIDIAQDMLDTLNFNFNHYVKNFGDTDLKCFIKEKF